MEIVKTHLRSVNCEVCNNRLLSIYVRGKKFRSLEGYYFCEKCNKIYKIGEEQKSI